MEWDKKLIPLCSPTGEVNPEAIKWMEHPFADCILPGSWGRRKRWVYWGIMSKDGAIGVTIADLDYLKLGGIYFTNFKNGYYNELGKITFSTKSIIVPNHPSGNAKFSTPDLTIDIVNNENEIKLEIDGEIKKNHIHGCIHIYLSRNHPTLNVVVPWSKKRFQFTSKQLPYPACGNVEINDIELDFSEAQCFACLDYGAGKWKYKTSWNWLAGSTLSESYEKRIGINLGGKWTDDTGQNENGLWLGHNFTKIHDDVVFLWDKKNPEKTWVIKTKNTDRLELTVEPTHIRRSKINLILLKSEVVQVFGTIKGRIRLDNDIIILDTMIGWAEEHNALW